MGFCYGGPCAIIGPKRLGFQAGVSCHGSQLLPFIEEVVGITEPIRLIWCERDHITPEPVLAAFKEAASEQSNLEVQIFAGVERGVMMPGSSAFDRAARGFAMKRAFAIMDDLRAS
jgi:carboxymethylenebutenolidase